MIFSAVYSLKEGSDGASSLSLTMTFIDLTSFKNFFPRKGRVARDFLKLLLNDDKHISIRLSDDGQKHFCIKMFLLISSTAGKTQRR